MLTQRLNKYTRKPVQRNSETLYRGVTVQEPIRNSQTGFIHHPHGFPLRYKRVWFADLLNGSKPTESSDIGLIFRSEKHLKPGITIELTIPLRNGNEKFRGKVVMVRAATDYFEIGLWLQRRADANRARLVEQVCHIEAYVQEKKYREGPYTLNRDKAAAEWISKYATTVPSL
ncbi:MAG: hypothetical protein ACR2P9_03445 [Gammaproteobacteria bacterium]